MNRNYLLKSRWFQITTGLCAAVLLYVFISNFHVLLSGISSFFHFVSPVLMAVVVAYVMNPLLNLMEEKVFYKIQKEKTRHQVSVLGSIAVVILALVLLLMVLIPQIGRSMAYLMEHIGIYSSQLQNLVNRIADQFMDRNVSIDSITMLVNQVLQKITSSILGNYDSLVETSFSIGRQVANWIIAFIMAIYFLMEKDALITGFKRLFHAVLKENVYEVTMDFLGRCHRILIRYIAFDLLDGLLVGIINFVLFKGLNIPYAGLISIIVGATNLAPTFGPIVGCLIGAFILLLINPVQALIFVIMTLILQTVDGYIIKPKLFGQTLGVSPIWILVFIIVGGRMFGVMGILMAIPAAAIFNFVYEEMIIAALEKRKSNIESDWNDSGSDQESKDRKVSDQGDAAEGTSAAVPMEAVEQ